MRYVTVALELFVAAFAVIGLYHTVRWMAGRLFGARNTVLAIEILTQRDAESAEVLIRDALCQYFQLPSGRLVILTVPELADDPVLRRAMKQYGVEGYLVLPYPKK